MRKRKGLALFSMFLIACLFALSFVMGAGVNVSAQTQQQYQYRYAQPRHNPQAGKKKAAKRIGIGTAIGVGAGGLLGGGRGALIGGALGAGGGTLFHFHKKHQYERRHY
jgi:hypothetical protein